MVEAVSHQLNGGWTSYSLLPFSNPTCAHLARSGPVNTICFLLKKYNCRQDARTLLSTLVYPSSSMSNVRLKGYHGKLARCKDMQRVWQGTLTIASALTKATSTSECSSECLRTYTPGSRMQWLAAMPCCDK